MTFSRRHFLVGVGTVTVAAYAGASPLNTFERQALLYPPMDLSSFDCPLDHGAREIKLGATATISSVNHQRIIAIAYVLGYTGIHLDSNILRRYSDPHELQDLLAPHKLTLVALSSGSIALDHRLDPEIIEAHVKNARYLRAAGGKYLLGGTVRVVSMESVNLPNNRTGHVLLKNELCRKCVLAINIGVIDPLKDRYPVL